LVCRLVGVWDEEHREYHLYLTNVGSDVLTAEEVAALYGLRWQIETVCTASRKQPSVSVEMPESISSRGLPLPCRVEA
ncbi:MAG: transposase, partial [Thermoplasmata archaeon]|nr:transposase [Thermoplasmata archaeon]